MAPFDYDRIESECHDAGGAGWFKINALTSDTANGAPGAQTVRIQNGEISAALAWRSRAETRWKISFTLDVATGQLPGV